LATHHPDLVQALQTISGTIGIGLALISLIIAGRRWRRATPAERRVLSPVYVTGAIAIVVIVVVLVIAEIANPSSRVPFYAFSISFIAIPLGYLFGILRTRLDRSSAVDTLFTRMPQQQYAPGDLREALREALNDPTLDLAYRRADGDEYVDVNG